MLDVAIIGAGPVGATVAALASDSGLDIGVFEARGGPSNDKRTLALSHASREILEGANAWPAQGVTPIESIHISQQGGPGRTLLEASEQRIPALGYTVAYAALESTLEARLVRSGVTTRFGEACTQIDLADDAATVRFESGREARARLLVLADGGANSTRIPGIAYTTKDYDQLALTAPVSTDRAHGARAYERFTPQGPAALLPVGDRFALVWTASPAEAKRLLALDDAAFLVELQAHFGDRAGRFTEVGPRAAFPLKLRTVNTNIALRTAIVGNAAQALHPVAGQGLNLGLRDAQSLATALCTRGRAAIGEAAMLADYRESRRRDTLRGVAFTDFLVSAFADARRLPTWGRGLALTVLDLFPPARRLLAQRMIHGAGSP
ncbi:FAD-dependent monooxygenase [Usitatibacter palustris]|uniref:2-octaprenyl-6-methoxyphenol hydroxylase n=1 Tax=Usitatibacter palustris TaxID=2732487 RepID=A0A6M4H2G1_9PROT|nr:FAD-dependent monooxygenase [Usitatibacter palustris]QJR13686.1 2-octaprenyl-6-methoxyphenol hydroxylase [Usitatibacter palustris]